MTSAAMAPSVHPTAVVDPRSRIGSGVEIGPYAVIGAEVEIGAPHKRKVSGPCLRVV